MRTLTTAIVAMGGVIAASCVDPRPTAPAGDAARLTHRLASLVSPTDWDFVALAGGDGPQGPAKAFTIAGAGSIVATVSALQPNHGFEPYTTGSASPPGSEERGLGLCGYYGVGGACVTQGGDFEIGDTYTDDGTGLKTVVPSLFLDFSGLAAGSVVTGVTLSSVQSSEGFSVWSSPDGVSYSLVSAGVGSDATVPNFSIPMPSDTKFARFDAGPGGAGNNYLVQSVTVQGPELVCTDQTAMNFGGPLPCEFVPPCPDGSFTFTYLNAGGDLVLKYDQFPAPNDNSYGVNAVGWGSHGHKFSDLVGSDHAGFQLVDGGGVVRLSFNVDYITADATAPSGYRSLGVLGGDGKMIVGTATGITATSSLANNLNNINIPGLFNASHVQQFGSVNLFIDSPPTDAAHLTYVNSDPTLAGWDFHDTYFVTISAAKLASIGFDPATWTVEPNADQLHNSPAKACPTGGTSGGVSDIKTEVKGKELKVTVLNSGTTDVFFTEIAIDWPGATNGKLMQVKLGAAVIYDKPDIAGGSADLTTAQLITDQNKRKIPHGKSAVLDFVFEKNIDPNLAHYASTIHFGSVALAILPK